MARRKDYQQLCKGVQRLAAASVVRIMKHFSKKSSLISSLEKPENLRYFQDSKRQRRREAGDTLLSLLPPRKKNYVSSSSTTVMMLGTPLVLWWTWPQANRLICAIGLNRQGCVAAAAVNSTKSQRPDFFSTKIQEPWSWCWLALSRKI